MSRTLLRESLIEAIILTASGGFVVWYICAKLALWPWGSAQLLPWCS